MVIDAAESVRGDTGLAGIAAGRGPGLGFFHDKQGRIAKIVILGEFFKLSVGGQHAVAHGQKRLEHTSGTGTAQQMADLGFNG